VRWGLRGSIVLALTGLLVVVTLLFSLVVLQVSERLLLREVSAAARATGDAIAAALRPEGDRQAGRDAWLHGGHLQARVEHLAQLPDVVDLTIVGPGLRILAHSDRRRVGKRLVAPLVGPVLLDGEARGRLAWRSDGQRIFVSHHPLLVEGQPVAVVRSRLTLGFLDQHLGSAQSLMLAYLAVNALVLLLVGSYLLDRVIVRPLRRVAEATERLEAGAFDPIDVIESNNEIGRLSVSFNRMVEALGRQRDSLRRNIEQLRQANQELAEARSSMIRAERLASVGTLAAGVAHELGNPLAAILGYTELLRDECRSQGGLTEGEAPEIVDRIHGQTLRIHHIIRDLLDYARARSLAERACTTPGPVVQRCLTLLEPQPRLRGVELSTYLAPDLPPVALDEGHLEQVLVNLLLNAADALDGVGGRIAIHGHSDGEGWVVLEVVDDGPGMEPEVVERAFDPFYTTKEPGRGTGLGLSICERVVGDADGELSIASVAGEGTRVTVRLPTCARLTPPSESLEPPDLGEA